MKVLFKYCVLFLVVLCLNIGLTKTLSTYNELSPITQETQFISHRAQSTQQAINNFYDHCPRMTCDIVQLSQDVPAAKYILRAVNLLGKSCSTQDHFKNTHIHPSFLYSSDPISYYVFGLRKIVI